MRALLVGATTVATALVSCAALVDLDGLTPSAESVGVDASSDAPPVPPADAGADTAVDASGTDAAPVALLSGFSGWGIALDDTNVYYTDVLGGQVGKVSKDGATKSVLVDASSKAALFDVKGLAVDLTDVYFGDVAGVYRCAKTGCMNSPQKLVDLSALGPPYEIDVDATSVYFTCSGASADGGVSDGVYRLDKATGASFKQLAALTAPNGLQVVGGLVYVALNDGSIVSVDASTGATTKLSPPASPGPALMLTVDQGQIFWTQLADPGGVLLMPTTGLEAGSAQFALLQHAPFAVTVDTSWVYWTNVVIPTSVPGKGIVNRCQRADCSKLETIASGYSLIRKIVNDGSAVYWTDQGDTTPATGGVFKWAKR